MSVLKRIVPFGKNKGKMKAFFFSSHTALCVVEMEEVGALRACWLMWMGGAQLRSRIIKTAAAPLRRRFTRFGSVVQLLRYHRTDAPQQL